MGELRPTVRANLGLGRPGAPAALFGGNNAADSKRKPGMEECRSCSYKGKRARKEGREEDSFPVSEKEVQAGR